MIIEVNGKRPQIAEGVFIAPDAVVAGNVTIGANSSVWFGCVIRGDNDRIVIGKNSNIQDHCTIHCNVGTPVEIGDYVSVGHAAVLHGCTVRDHSLIGMSATVLNDAVIGENCLVGASSLITEGKIFEPNSLILGSPAKVKSQITEEQKESIQKTADTYVKIKDYYRNK